MSKSSNIIQINGKRYDASTGLPVEATESSPTVVRPAKVAAPAKAADRHREPPHHTAHHKPQAAQTLMRRSVHKPSLAKAAKTGVKKPKAGSAIAKIPQAVVAPKSSVQLVDRQRAGHARQVPKSSLVKRFSATPLDSWRPTAIAAPAPAVPRTAKPVAAPEGDDLFRQALHHATSHQQPTPKKPHRHSPAARKIIAISGAALAVVLVAGIVSYQNVGNVKLRLAAARAGVSASLPNYRPSGYSAGSFSSAPGQVAARFTSNSDSSRQYTITEKASGLDSTSLRDTVVMPADANYQTVTVHGTTVYLYGPDKAAWVSNGIWYTIDGNGSLSSRQLQDLAASL